MQEREMGCGAQPVVKQHIHLIFDCLGVFKRFCKADNDATEGDVNSCLRMLYVLGAIQVIFHVGSFNLMYLLSSFITYRKIEVTVLNIIQINGKL